MAFYNSIKDNFVVYQDRFEINVLQLFAHPQTSEWLLLLLSGYFKVF